MKSSDKMWSTGGGNDNPLQYSHLENPRDSMKKQKDMMLEESPPGQKVSNMLLGKRGGQLLIAPVRMKWLGQSRNDTQLWLCLVLKVKSDTVFIGRTVAEVEAPILWPPDAKS